MTHMSAKKYKTKKKLLKRKKAKANKKLIAIVGFIFASLLIGGAGAWYVVVYKSADRNIRAGDEYMAAGDYYSARKQYGRAVSKEQSNIDFVHKLQDAILSIAPTTPDEASTYYRDYITSLVHESRYKPLDIDAQLKVVEEIFESAHLTGNMEDWRRLQMVTKTGLERIMLDDPRSHELLLYRGLASLRIEDTSMTETFDGDGNIRFPGEDDIEEVLEKEPNNEIAWAALAHGRMAIYYRLLNEGRTQQALKNREFFDITMKRAIEVAGDSLEVSLTYLRAMLLQRNALSQVYVVNPDDVSAKQMETVEIAVQEAMDRLVSSYNPSIHNNYVGQIVTLLGQVDREGKEIAVDVLQQHMSMYPDDVKRRFVLVGQLHNLKRLDEAGQEARYLLDADQLTVGLQAMEQYRTRPFAAQVLVQLSLDHITEDSTDEEREEFVKEARAAREILSDLVSNNTDSPLLLYSDGIIALIEKDYSAAAVRLEEVISRIPSAPSRVYRESAFALAESGARGLASERLAVALEREPSNLANYLLKARIELMISDIDAAQQTLAQLPPDSQSRPEVQELFDTIALNRSKGDAKFSDPILAIISQSIIETANRQYDDAIKTLTDAIVDKQESPDWRLLAALSNVYISMQDLDTASNWIRKAIEINPDSEQLARILINLEYDDPVAATIASVEARQDSIANKAEELAVKLFNIGTYQLSESNRWAKRGSVIEAEDAKELAQRALEESMKYQQIAEVEGADMSRILYIKVKQAITDLEFGLAEEYFEKLSAKSDDQLELDGLRIRMHLVKATQAKEKGVAGAFELNTDKALSIAKAMTEEVSFSDYAWRMLGAVYAVLEEPIEELAANAEAYRIAPKDRGNIRRYLGSLATTNADSQRLLRVARMSQEQFPADKQLTEVWLEIEFSIGLKPKVFEYRFNQYSKNPLDRTNALRLASLLVNTEPSRELFRNRDGSQMITPRMWSRLGPIQRTQVLTRESEAWNSIAQEIMDAASEEVDPDVRTAFIHASVARDRGQLDESSRIWDRFIQSRKGTAEYSNAVISAADFLQQSNRFEQAITLLKEAKEFQSDRFEMDAALGSINYFLGNYEEAAESLQIAVDATASSILHARLIESLANSGQFDRAETLLESYNTTNQAYGEAMLRALISRVRSEQLLAQGDLTGGTAELTVYRNALRAAISEDPENPVPYIRLCRSLLNEYQMTQEKALLEESLVVADEGSAIQDNSEQFAVVRADVLQADGQLLRAIDRMVRFIAEQPTASIIRQRLIEAYLDTDDINKAIAVAKAGIEVDSSEPIWYSRLGDLYVRSNDERGEATKAYLSALQREPTMLLIARIDEITRTEQLLPNLELLSMAQGPMSKMHPIVASIEAKALNNLGRNRDALIAMEKSWNMFQQAISNGWIPESSTASWFLDLKEMYVDNPEQGEAFVRSIVGGPLSLHHQAGLAGYYQAFGGEYWNKALGILDAAIEKTVVGTNVRSRLLMMRGGFLVELGRYEESAVAFRLLANEQDSPIVWNNLAYVVGIYLNHPEQGLEIAKQAVVKAPRSAPIIDTVAILYEHIGESQKAAETLEFLLQVSPSNAEAMARLALIYADSLGQPERAIVFAERARSQKPRSAEVLDALGWSYYRMGRIMKAEEYIERSIKREESSIAYLHLAQLVMARSEFDEALGHLRMAQELAKHPYSLNRIKVLRDDIRKAQATVSE